MDSGDANESSGDVLTSTMGGVVSGGANENAESAPAVDSVPSSSSDASNVDPAIRKKLPDDPISSTSDVGDRVDFGGRENDALSTDESRRPFFKSDLDNEVEMFASECNLTNISADKITENVEDIVSDLENLLGSYSSLPLNKSRSDEVVPDLDDDLLFSVTSFDEKKTEKDSINDKISTKDADKSASTSSDNVSTPPSVHLDCNEDVKEPQCSAETKEESHISEATETPVLSKASDEVVEESTKAPNHEAIIPLLVEEEKPQTKETEDNTTDVKSSGTEDKEEKVETELDNVQGDQTTVDSSIVENSSKNENPIVPGSYEESDNTQAQKTEVSKVSDESESEAKMVEDTSRDTNIPSPTEKKAEETIDDSVTSTIHIGNTGTSNEAIPATAVSKESSAFDKETGSEKKEDPKHTDTSTEDLEKAKPPETIENSATAVTEDKQVESKAEEDLPEPKGDDSDNAVDVSNRPEETTVVESQEQKFASEPERQEDLTNASTKPEESQAEETVTLPEPKSEISEEQAEVPSPQAKQEETNDVEDKIKPEDKDEVEQETTEQQEEKGDEIADTDETERETSSREDEIQNKILEELENAMKSDDIEGSDDYVSDVEEPKVERRSEQGEKSIALPKVPDVATEIKSVEIQDNQGSVEVSSRVVEALQETNVVAEPIDEKVEDEVMDVGVTELKSVEVQDNQESVEASSRVEETNVVAEPIPEKIEDEVMDVSVTELKPVEVQDKQGSVEASSKVEALQGKEVVVAPISEDVKDVEMAESAEMKPVEVQDNQEDVEALGRVEAIQETDMVPEATVSSNEENRPCEETKEEPTEVSSLQDEQLSIDKKKEESMTPAAPVDEEQLSRNKKEMESKVENPSVADSKEVDTEIKETTSDADNNKIEVEQDTDKDKILETAVENNTEEDNDAVIPQVTETNTARSNENIAPLEVSEVQDKMDTPEDIIASTPQADVSENVEKESLVQEEVKLGGNTDIVDPTSQSDVSESIGKENVQEDASDMQEDKMETATEDLVEPITLNVEKEDLIQEDEVKITAQVESKAVEDEIPDKTTNAEQQLTLEKEVNPKFVQDIPGEDGSNKNEIQDFEMEEKSDPDNKLDIQEVTNRGNSEECPKEEPVTIPDTATVKASEEQPVTTPDVAPGREEPEIIPEPTSEKPQDVEASKEVPMDTSDDEQQLPKETVSEDQEDISKISPKLTEEAIDGEKSSDLSNEEQPTPNALSEAVPEEQEDVSKISPKLTEAKDGEKSSDLSNDEQQLPKPSPETASEDQEDVCKISTKLTEEAKDGDKSSDVSNDEQLPKALSETVSEDQEDILKTSPKLAEDKVDNSKSKHEEKPEKEHFTTDSVAASTIPTESILEATKERASEESVTSEIAPDTNVEMDTETSAASTITTKDISEANKEKASDESVTSEMVPSTNVEMETEEPENALQNSPDDKSTEEINVTSALDAIEVPPSKDESKEGKKISADTQATTLPVTSETDDTISKEASNATPSTFVESVEVEEPKEIVPTIVTEPAASDVTSATEEEIKEQDSDRSDVKPMNAQDNVPEVTCDNSPKPTLANEENLEQVGSSVTAVLCEGTATVIENKSTEEESETVTRTATHEEKMQEDSNMSSVEPTVDEQKINKEETLETVDEKPSNDGERIEADVTTLTERSIEEHTKIGEDSEKVVSETPSLGVEKDAVKDEQSVKSAIPNEDNIQNMEVEEISQEESISEEKETTEVPKVDFPTCSETIAESNSEKLESSSQMESEVILETTDEGSKEGESKESANEVITSNLLSKDDEEITKEESEATTDVVMKSDEIDQDSATPSAIVAEDVELATTIVSETVDKADKPETSVSSSSTSDSEKKPVSSNENVLVLQTDVEKVESEIAMGSKNSTEPEITTPTEAGPKDKTPETSTAVSNDSKTPTVVIDVKSEHEIKDLVAETKADDSSAKVEDQNEAESEIRAEVTIAEANPDEKMEPKGDTKETLAETKSENPSAEVEDQKEAKLEVEDLLAEPKSDKQIVPKEEAEETLAERKPDDPSAKMDDQEEAKSEIKAEDTIAEPKPDEQIEPNEPLAEPKPDDPSAEVDDQKEATSEIKAEDTIAEQKPGEQIEPKETLVEPKADDPCMEVDDQKEPKSKNDTEQTIANHPSSDYQKELRSEFVTEETLTKPKTTEVDNKKETNIENATEETIVEAKPDDASTGLDGSTDSKKEEKTPSILNQDKSPKVPVKDDVTDDVKSLPKEIMLTNTKEKTEEPHSEASLKDKPSKDEIETKVNEIGENKSAITEEKTDIDKQMGSTVEAISQISSENIKESKLAKLEESHAASKGEVVADSQENLKNASQNIVENKKDGKTTSVRITTRGQKSIDNIKINKEDAKTEKSSMSVIGNATEAKTDKVKKESVVQSDVARVDPKQIEKTTKSSIDKDIKNADTEKVKELSLDKTINESVEQKLQSIIVSKEIGEDNEKQSAASVDNAKANEENEKTNLAGISIKDTKEGKENSIALECKSSDVVTTEDDKNEIGDDKKSVSVAVVSRRGRRGKRGSTTSVITKPVEEKRRGRKRKIVLDENETSISKEMKVNVTNADSEKPADSLTIQSLNAVSEPSNITNTGESNLDKEDPKKVVEISPLTGRPKRTRKRRNWDIENFGDQPPKRPATRTRSKQNNAEANKKDTTKEQTSVEEDKSLQSASVETNSPESTEVSPAVEDVGLEVENEAEPENSNRDASEIEDELVKAALEASSSSSVEMEAEITSMEESGNKEDTTSVKSLKMEQEKNEELALIQAAQESRSRDVESIPARTIVKSKEAETTQVKRVCNSTEKYQKPLNIVVEQNINVSVVKEAESTTNEDHEIVQKDLSSDDDKVEEYSSKMSQNQELKLTITKNKSEETSSILKIFDPKNPDRVEISHSESETESEETPIPKLIIKQSPKMLSPLKITIKPVVKPEEQQAQKSSPKLIIKPIVKPDEEPKHVEEKHHSPKITIKPIPKPTEDSERCNSPKITIKPIIKPCEASTSPKIKIKPIVKPEEHKEEALAEDDESKERIVLKINKNNIPQKEAKKNEETEKLAKIKLKFSKEGGHAHIVNEEAASSDKPKRPNPDEPEVESKKFKADHAKPDQSTFAEDVSVENPSQDRGTPDVSKEDVGAEMSTPEVTPPVAKKRGRPRKLPLKVREDFKDPNPPAPEALPTRSPRRSRGRGSRSGVESPVVVPIETTPIQIPVSEEAPSMFAPEVPAPASAPPTEYNSGRPKRSCRGPSVTMTLGIKPRKPRQPRGVSMRLRSTRGRGGNVGVRGGKVEKPPKKEKITESKLKLIKEAAITARVTESLENQDVVMIVNENTSEPVLEEPVVEEPEETKIEEVKETITETKEIIPETKEIVPESVVVAEPEIVETAVAAPPEEPTITLPDVIIIEEETRMSADTSSRAETPAKQEITQDVVVEESQSSVQSTATTESTKARKGHRMEVQPEPESSMIVSAEQLAEYYWAGGGPYMLQEQVAQFLGIKSFKRKYPGIPRRPVDMQERDFIRETGLTSEHMCDLGLTAVNSADILDIMYSDFQHKYEEYCKYQREKQTKDIANKQKALSLAASQEKNKLDIMQAAIESAAQWNTTFNKSRREDRKACMDLQTFTINYPKGNAKQITKPKIGHYPIALVPGQYTDYYKTYTPTEINNLPLNTMLYNPIHPHNEEDSQSDGSGSDSDSSTSGSGSSDSDSSEDDCNICSSNSVTSKRAVV